MRHFHSRVLAPLVLALAPLSATADGSGALNDATLSLDYTSAAYFVPNVTGETGAAGGSAICEQGTPTCDVFELTIDFSDDFRKEQPDASVDLVFTWGAQSDYDIFVYNSSGELVGSATNFVGEGGDFVFLFLESLSNGVYRVEVVPYLPMGSPFSLKARVTGLTESKNGVLGVGALPLALLLPFALLTLPRRQRQQQ